MTDNNEYVPDEGPYSAEELREESQMLLTQIRQMAQDEGCESSFNFHLKSIRRRFDALGEGSTSQRAFLLAIAYFGEETQNDL